MNRFTVIDKHTGKYPNTWSIARRCKWAKHLVYCDIDGFALTEDGNLLLMDDCGGVAYCPKDRFEIVWEDEEKSTAQSKAIPVALAEQDDGRWWFNCGECDSELRKDDRFCSTCGKKIDWVDWKTIFKGENHE